MQRISFDFDVITGPTSPRPAPTPQPQLKPDTAQSAAQSDPRQEKGAGK